MMADEDIFEGSDGKADLSPMIDLVFLLLIFFIVTANLIDFPKDPRVKPSIASDSKVSEDGYDGRVVMNILQDGTLVDVTGKVISLEGLTKVMSQAKVRNPKQVSLHLRVGRRAQYGFVKKASRASAEGGVTKVIFSTYTQ